MKRILPIVVGLLLFVYLFMKQVNINETLAMLKKADALLLAAGLLLFVCMTYLKGVRWSYLLRMQGHSYSVWNCFLIYMATLYMGNLTPGRAGDFAKVFYLKQDLNLSPGTGMASVLLDRVFDLYLLLILGGIGILAYPMEVDPLLIRSVWAFFALMTVITVLAFNKKIGGMVLKAAFHRLMKQSHREKTDKLFHDFHDGMESFYRPAIIVPTLLSLASYACFFSGCYLIAQAIALPISILYLSFCVSVVNIVSLLTFMGMGTREGALMILFHLIGLSKDQAMAYSLLLLFVGLILFSLLGLICFFLKPISIKGFSLSGSSQDA